MLLFVLPCLCNLVFIFLKNKSVKLHINCLSKGNVVFGLRQAIEKKPRGEQSDFPNRCAGLLSQGQGQQRLIVYD